MRYVSKVDKQENQYTVTNTNDGTVSIMSLNEILGDSEIDKIKGVLSTGEIKDYSMIIEKRPLAVKSNILGVIDKYFMYDHSDLIPIYIDRVKAVVPDWVNLIVRVSFAQSPDIREVIFGKNVIRLSSGVFHGRTSLESVSFQEGLTHIEPVCFKDTSLREILLPDTVKVIGRDAFMRCNSLEVVRIPDTLRVLSNTAFAECTNIRTINIPMGYSGLAETLLNNNKNLDKESRERLLYVASH